MTHISRRLFLKGGLAAAVLVAAHVLVFELRRTHVERSAEIPATATQTREVRP